MTSSQYQPGVYVKGDDERVANRAADAVALVFDGYKLKEDGKAEQAKPAATGPSETSATPDTPSGTPAAPARPRPPRESSTSTS